MSKRNIKVWAILFFALFSSLVISACGSNKETKNESIYSELNRQIINIVLENYEDGDSISAEDIAIDQIFYGTFSQEGVSEILVTCKILNQPHVAGLDKTVGVLLNTDTMEMIAYKEFSFDRVVINCMKTSSGYNRILVLGTSTTQGISTQDVCLFAIRGNQWVDTPMDVLETISVEPREAPGEEYYCFVTDDRMIVSYEDKLTNPEEMITILRWNPDIEQFVIDGGEQ